MQKSLWQSYLALTPRTRAALGLVGVGFSLAGMYASNQMERVSPAAMDRRVDLLLQEPSKEQPPARQ
ncbi:hypothetical protein RI367_004611 [Sorochytrium milnesiophthora]